MALLPSPYPESPTLHTVINDGNIIVLQIAVVHQFVHVHSHVKAPLHETVHAVQLVHKLLVGRFCEKIAFQHLQSINQAVLCT
ncbi:MAG: hypothetical protein LBF15_06485 [Candidatus Peribacteria bacterium]|nr:hypothetical protein [Candidatus Peribacteria bacterium]